MKELKDFLSEADNQRKGKKVSEATILREIQAYRLERRSKKVTSPKAKQNDP